MIDDRHEIATFCHAANRAGSGDREHPAKILPAGSTFHQTMRRVSMSNSRRTSRRRSRWGFSNRRNRSKLARWSAIQARHIAPRRRASQLPRTECAVSLRSFQWDTASWARNRRSARARATPWYRPDPDFDIHGPYCRLPCDEEATDSSRGSLSRDISVRTISSSEVGIVPAKAVMRSGRIFLIWRSPLRIAGSRATSRFGTRPITISQIGDFPTTPATRNPANSLRLGNDAKRPSYLAALASRTNSRKPPARPSRRSVHSTRCSAPLAVSLYALRPAPRTDSVHSVSVIPLRSSTPKAR